MDYVKLWVIYKYYNVWDRKLLGCDEMQAQFDKQIMKEYKIRTGKASKNLKKIHEFFGKEAIDEMSASFLKIYKEKLENRKAIKANMERLLKEHAKVHTIIASPEMYLLKTTDGGSWHTQGWGGNKYARVALAEDELLLQLHGFKTEVREIVDQHPSKDGTRYKKYELWANITEFDFWMLNHSGNFISVLNWAVLCWRKGTNPKVYFPFLSDEDYENSLKLSRDLSYVITKDNCQLEPKP